MAEPTLQEIFGTNALQDAEKITIYKSDLVGLNASSENTGESLFVAVVTTAQNYLSETNFNNNIDQSLYLNNGISSFTDRENAQYRLDQITLNLTKLDDGNVVNPNDY